jgi:hypothetical protein
MPFEEIRPFVFSHNKRQTERLRLKGGPPDDQGQSRSDFYRQEEHFVCNKNEIIENLQSRTILHSRGKRRSGAAAAAFARTGPMRKLPGT